MTIVPSSLDYTSKDRAALERRINSLIDSAFPNWTDKSKANFGNLLLELFGHVGDIHSFYIDQWARESRIGSAQLRRSLLALIKLIDYTPSTRSAATVDLDVVLPAARATDVTYPAGSIVYTQSASTPIPFQLLTDLTIAAGGTTGSVSAEHSETITEAISSDGTPNQTFRLTRTPVVLQTGVPAVVFGDGAYTRVTNLLNSGSTDKHYVLNIDANDRATLTFGNGSNGAIPVGTGSVVYKIGGGSEGNIEPGDINRFASTFYDGAGLIVQQTVTNAAAASGGAERESNAAIRQTAPKAARVSDRAVAREDFEIVAIQVNGVARALAVTSEEDAAIGENQLYLFIVPEGGGVASTALLNEIKGKFQTVTGQPAPTHPTINTLDLRVQTATYASVDVTVRAHRASGYTTTEMKTAIDTVLNDFFGVTITASRLIEIAPKIAANNGITAADGDSVISNPLVSYGFEYKDADDVATGLLPWSDIFNVIRDLPQVRKVDASDGLLLDSLRADADIGTLKFPTKGTVVVIDGDTGAIL